MIEPVRTRSKHKWRQPWETGWDQVLIAFSFQTVWLSTKQETCICKTSHKVDQSLVI